MVYVHTRLAAFPLLLHAARTLSPVGRMRVQEGPFGFERAWAEVSDGLRLYAHRFAEPASAPWWHCHPNALYVAVLDPGYTLLRCTRPAVPQTATVEEVIESVTVSEPSSYAMTEPTDWHAVLTSTSVRTFALLAPFGQLDAGKIDLDELRTLHANWLP